MMINTLNIHRRPYRKHTEVQCIAALKIMWATKLKIPCLCLVKKTNLTDEKNREGHFTEGEVYLRCPMKQTLDSSSQQHSTHPSFRRPKPAAGLETLWKTPPTPAPLWHARLPLTQAPTVHQGELRGDLQDTNQSGWPSGRAQPAGTRAGSPPGNASECPFCPAARPLPLDLRALEKAESPPPRNPAAD